jgi:hypothetical protein
MKKTLPMTLLILAVILFFWNLTKIANQAKTESTPGTAFALKAQHVVQCSAVEITLVDNHQKATHLDKDSTWPECSVFQKGDVLDFYLSRGEKTRLLSYESTAWWRKAM